MGPQVQPILLIANLQFFLFLQLFQTLPLISTYFALAGSRLSSCSESLLSLSFRLPFLAVRLPDRSFGTFSSVLCYPSHVISHGYNVIGNRKQPFTCIVLWMWIPFFSNYLFSPLPFQLISVWVPPFQFFEILWAQSIFSWNTEMLESLPRAAVLHRSRGPVSKGKSRSLHLFCFERHQPARAHCFEAFFFRNMHIFSFEFC